MTKEEAARKTADSIVKIICGKSQPTRFPRVRELTEAEQEQDDEEEEYNARVDWEMDKLR
jgi:hypothetical protein